MYFIPIDINIDPQMPFGYSGLELYLFEFLMLSEVERFW